MPAVRDATCPPVLPQPPMSAAAAAVGPADKVVALQNPCAAAVGPLLLAAGSSDLLKALSAGELCRLPPGGAGVTRLPALASHVVGQCSLYPLYPAPPGACLVSSAAAFSAAIDTAGGPPRPTAAIASNVSAGAVAAGPSPAAPLEGQGSTGPRREVPLPPPPPRAGSVQQQLESVLYELYSRKGGAGAEREQIKALAVAIISASSTPAPPIVRRGRLSGSALAAACGALGVVVAALAGCVAWIVWVLVDQQVLHPAALAGMAHDGSFL